MGDLLLYVCIVSLAPNIVVLAPNKGEVGGVVGVMGLRFGIFSGIVLPVFIVLFIFGDPGILGVVRPIWTGVLRPVRAGFVCWIGFARPICGLLVWIGVVGLDPSPLVYPAAISSGSMCRCCCRRNMDNPLFLFASVVRAAGMGL